MRRSSPFLARRGTLAATRGAVKPEKARGAGMQDAWLARQAYSVAALRRLARARLPRMVFDFVDGGAEEERTLRANEAAFADVTLWPRPLNGTSLRSQAVELLGHRLDLPVGIGSTGLS